MIYVRKVIHWFIGGGYAFVYLKNTSQWSPSNLTEMQDLMVIKNKVLPGMRKCAAFSADSIFSCMQNAKKTKSEVAVPLNSKNMLRT